MDPPTNSGIRGRQQASSSAVENLWIISTCFESTSHSVQAFQQRSLDYYGQFSQLLHHRTDIIQLLSSNSTYSSLQHNHCMKKTVPVALMQCTQPDGWLTNNARYVYTWPLSVYTLFAARPLVVAAQSLHEETASSVVHAMYCSLR